MYYIAMPRTLCSKHKDFGVWDIVKDDNGEYVEFETVEEAREAIGNDPCLYIIQIVG